MPRPCAATHCSGADAELNEFCKLIYANAPDGYAGKPVATRDANGPCFCTCSCLAFDTPIEYQAGSFKPVQSFVRGDTVRVATGTLTWTTAQVQFSSGTAAGSTQPDAIFVEFDGGDIVTTSDHLFLLFNKRLRRANRLSIRDQLMRADGSASRIKSVKRGYYIGGFHHIATSKNDPQSSYDGHLINTNGIVSADYTVQLFGDQFLTAADDALPVVGTTEYESANGIQPEPSPASRTRYSMTGETTNRTQGLTIHGANSFALDALKARAAEKPHFVETKQVRLRVPDDACRFISDQDAQQKKSEQKRTGAAAILAREEASGLIYHFSVHYRDVVYHLDWDDDTVNAFAWVENGVRHVALLGGLLRHWAIRWESTALVLAHELAHHFGGAPTFPHGLSCEGQADHHGGGVIMRRVFYGDFYVQTMTPAITQIGNFFSPNPGNHGCNHPSRDCRVSIYNAAVDLKPIPACAFAV